MFLPELIGSLPALPRRDARFAVHHAQYRRLPIRWESVMIYTAKDDLLSMLGFGTLLALAVLPVALSWL